MPIPKPQKGETQDKFISRCIGDSVMVNEFPDQKQRAGVCYSQWGDSKKEIKFLSKVYGYETKERDDDFIIGGYIATTHLDDGFFDDARGKYIRDKISKETLLKWAEQINQGIPRVNKVSVNHKREPHVTGVGVRDSARVDILPDGEYGLYVESLIDKTKENFDELKYRLDKDLLDSFSIEFTTIDPINGTYLPNAANEIESGNGIIRTLLPGTILEGWTLASQPMNAHAIRIKEIIHSNNLEEKGIIKNNEEIKIKDNREEISKMVEEKTKELILEKKEEEDSVIIEDEETEEESIEDKELFKKFKKDIKMEKKEKEYNKLKETILNEVKESLKDIKIENKVQVNSENIESKEYVEYKEMLGGKSNVAPSSQFYIAGKLADSLGLTSDRGVKSSTIPAESRKFGDTFRTNGGRIEYKALGITTNVNSDTDYLLSAAELADVFDPVIYNYLNQKVTTWNLLEKDDYSTKGNNQVQFTIKTGRNTTASAYTGNAVTTGNVTRQKYMTKFKKYQVGVEVDGDMIAAARGGPIGDLFAQEVRDSTDDLMEVMNQALFAEVGLESAAGVIGFEYIADSAGNTTLYNVTRSTTNQLSPTTATDTYINGSSVKVSVSNLRKAIRQTIEEGASLNRLFFVCSPIQYDMIKSLYDDLQRLPPVSSRFGFEGRIEFEGVPVFYDKDCNDDDIFLVDQDTHRVAIWVPPTLEMLGKDADSQKGFIKTYWCTYNRAPRRLVMIYGNATS